MIRLGRLTVSAVAVPAFAAGFAVSAHADVLEVGSDGARWVTQPAASTESAAAVLIDGAFAIPEGALVDPYLTHSRLPPAYAAKVYEVAARFDLSPALLEAVIWQESRWRADAVSPVGARGLGQLMPGTARELGIDPNDPMQNLEGCARYLRQMLDRFDGNVELALAAYNAGPGRVERAGGIPNIRETQLYVVAVLDRVASISRSN